MHSFIDLCFKRPVAVTACYLVFAALAVAALLRFPVALLPEIQYPTLVVWTEYADVAPEQVERTVTSEIEEAVAGTAGLLNLNSRSLLGGSLSRLDFGWNVNLDLAQLEVREQLDKLGNRLPEAAAKPIVLRYNPTDTPIMTIALRESSGGSNQDLVALRELARDVVSRRIEQLPDIARVRVTGGFNREIVIEIESQKLALHGITLQEVGTAIRRANVSLPGGMIRRGPFRYAVEVSGEFESVMDIGQTVVKRSGALPIRIADVSTVRESIRERNGMVRLDGTETLLLLVEKRPDANTVRAATAVRTEIDRLNQELGNARLDVLIDESSFISDAITGVRSAVFLGGIFAILVLLFFIRERRSLLAVALAIPASIAITLVFFDAFGITFNLISLSGLALGVGMLVDNAIVVVENIARKRDEGLEAIRAAKEGAAEVAGAITASTLTTVAVFAPLLFIEGLAGRLFRDQSIAVICSLLASLLVALTLVPLVSHGATKSGSRSLRPSWMERYEKSLRWCLDHSGVVIAVATGIVLMSLLLLTVLPREVVPPTSQGRSHLQISMAPDTDLDLLAVRSLDLANSLRTHEGVGHVLEDLGERDEARLDLEPRAPFEGDIIVIHEASIDNPIDSVISGDTSVSDVLIEWKDVETQLEQLLSPAEADMYVDLVADDRRSLIIAADELQRTLAARDELANVIRPDADAVPAYRLELDRDAMSRFGITSQHVADYLEAAARGIQVSDLKTINDEIPIVVRSRRGESLEVLLLQQVPTPRGLIPLSEFVSLHPEKVPASLRRRNQSNIVRIHADIAASGDLKQSVSAIEQELDNLGSEFRATVSGSNEAFDRSLRAAGISLLISILLVYLILAAQFESLIQPLVILSAVPLAIAGVAIVLFITNQSLNLMSLTGCVVLVGIVVNDAIVKVEFINRRMVEGASRREAILQAGRERLRPILMTTITTILGLLPLALSIGRGAELRSPLAIVVIGGIASCTILTLLVIPVLYDKLNTRKYRY